MLNLVRAECDVAFICRTYIKHGIDPANATRKGKLETFYDITRVPGIFKSRWKTPDQRMAGFQPFLKTDLHASQKYQKSPDRIKTLVIT